MIDPAIIHDLQRAMVPPAPPVAIVREWLSPLAEDGGRASAPILADAQKRSDEWRSRLSEFEAAFSYARELEWEEENLRDFDAAINRSERQVKINNRALARSERRADRINKHLLAHDPSAAKVQNWYYEQMAQLQRSNTEAIKAMLVKMRALRAAVDYRSGAEPGYVFRSWKPNADTVAAMERARAGELETVTLDDLRAAILADD